MDWVGLGPELYAAAYFAGLCGVAAWEGLAPRRTHRTPLGPRWARNVGLTVLDNALVRWIVPLAGVGVAIAVARSGLGLLPWLGVGGGAAFVLGLVALDFGRWLQHLLLHRVPWLWRLHGVHHSDRDYDFTTALRFHPLEALYTAGFNAAVIVLVGAPVEAVVAYELVAVTLVAFAHGNVRLPAAVDGGLRLAVVTPDLHRVHHSIDPGEQATNFAGVTPWWDRLFGTYRAHPALGHEAMGIGLAGHEDAGSQSFVGMLAQPFGIRPPGGAAASDGREAAGAGAPATPGPA